MRLSLSALLFAFIFAVAAGCTQSGYIGPPPATIALPSTSTPTRPESTPTITFPTATASQAVTSPPAATLSPEEQSAFWIETISSNTGCQLPCWWGLTPGKSAWSDLDSLFSPLGARPLPPWNSSKTSRFDLYLHIVPGPSLQPVQFAVLEREGLIEGFDLKFMLGEYPWLDDAASKYSLASLLTQVGTPSEVLVHLPGAPAELGGGWRYGIWLFYANSGLAAFYEGGGLTASENGVVVCPRYEATSQIDLFLRAPSPSLSLEEITSGQASIRDQLASGELVALEEAASLTTAQFYDSLRTEGGCIASHSTR